MFFYIFIAFLISLRTTELFISKNNERWLLKKGAVEYGQRHYPFIIALHVLFFVSLINEYKRSGDPTVSYIFLILFLLLLAARVWMTASLGRFFTTKIYYVPGEALVKKGPYKYLKHPNYIIVICEIAIIPLIFHLYVTAIIFSLLNALMLSIRIKEENKVLSMSKGSE